MQAPMPQGQPAPGAEPQAKGGASKLVTDIHNGLMQLMDMMSQSSAMDDDDKQKLGALIEGYQEFVSGLGSAPGQKPEAKPGTGMLPSEAGAAAVRPVL